LAKAIANYYSKDGNNICWKYILQGLLKFCRNHLGQNVKALLSKVSIGCEHKVATLMEDLFSCYELDKFYQILAELEEMDEKPVKGNIFETFLASYLRIYF
jgi:hypothetical protein